MSARRGGPRRRRSSAARPRRRSVSGPLRPHAHAGRGAASTGTTARAGRASDRRHGARRRPVLLLRASRASSRSRRCATGPGESSSSSPGRVGDAALRRVRPSSTSATGSASTGDGDEDPQGRALGEGHATSVLLAKALRPFPDKWHGLTDVDTRYRQRYVDLIANDDARRVFDDPLHGDRRSRGGSSPTAASSRSRRRCCTRSRAARPRAVRHAPQRARHRPVPAHRARAVPQAAHRRRLREGVRDRARVPQRRALDAPQPRVHDARAVRGVRRLHRHDAAHRGARRRPRAPSPIGTTDGRVRRPRPRPHAAVARGDDDRPRSRSTRASTCTRRSRSRSCARSATSSTCTSKDDVRARASSLLEIYEKTTEAELSGPDVRRGLPGRGVAARARPPRRSRAHRAVRGRSSPAASSATRSASSNDPVDQRARFEAQAPLASAGDDEAHGVDDDYMRALEYGLPADRWPGHRHRSAGDAARRTSLDPRGHLVPDPAAGTGLTGCDC